MTTPSVSAYGASGWRLANDRSQIFHSDDDRYLISFEDRWRQRIEVIDLQTGLPLAAQYPGKVRAFAQRDNQLVIINDNQLTLTCLSQLDQCHSVLLDTDTCAVAISPDGSRIAVGLKNNQLLLLDNELNQCHQSELEVPAALLRFSPDGSQLAIYATQDKTQRLWLQDCDTNQLTQLKGSRGAIKALCWAAEADSADTLVAASGKVLYRWPAGVVKAVPLYKSDADMTLLGVHSGRAVIKLANDIVVLDASAGDEVWRWQWDNVVVASMTAGHVAYGENRELCVRDIVTGEQRLSVASPDEWFQFVSLSHDGGSVCCSDWNHALYRWQLADGMASHPLAPFSKAQQLIPLTAAGQWLTLNSNQAFVWQQDQPTALQRYFVPGADVIALDEEAGELWHCGFRLSCVSLVSGKRIKKLATGLPGDAACLCVIDARRLLYISASGRRHYGHLVQLDRDSGEVLSDHKIDFTVIAAELIDGAVLLQSRGGDRYRYDLASHEVTPLSHYSMRYSCGLHPLHDPVVSVSPSHSLILEYGDIDDAPSRQKGGNFMLAVTDANHPEEALLEKEYPLEIDCAALSADQSQVLSCHKTPQGGYCLTLTALTDGAAEQHIELPLQQDHLLLGSAAPKVTKIHSLADQSVLLSFSDGQLLRVAVGR